MVTSGEAAIASMGVVAAAGQPESEGFTQEAIHRKTPQRLRAASSELPVTRPTRPPSSRPKAGRYGDLARFLAVG